MSTARSRRTSAQIERLRGHVRHAPRRPRSSARLPTLIAHAAGARRSCRRRRRRPNGTPPPPFPLPPGVDRGATVAVVRETLTRGAARAGRAAGRSGRGPRPLPRAETNAEAPLARWSRRRRARCRSGTTFVVAISPRGRKSPPSTPRVGAARDASELGAVERRRHEHRDGMTITWAPSPDARTSTFCCRRPSSRSAGANATPATSRRGAPPLPPLRQVAGFNTQATTYHVYEVTPPRVARRPVRDQAADAADAGAGRHRRVRDQGAVRSARSAASTCARRSDLRRAR